MIKELELVDEKEETFCLGTLVSMIKELELMDGKEETLCLGISSDILH
jgi:hypothetical protein